MSNKCYDDSTIVGISFGCFFGVLLLTLISGSNSFSEGLGGGAMALAFHCVLGICLGALAAIIVGVSLAYSC